MLLMPALTLYFRDFGPGSPPPPLQQIFKAKKRQDHLEIKRFNILKDKMYVYIIHMYI